MILSSADPILMVELYREICEIIKKDKPKIELNNKKIKLVDYRQNAYSIETAHVINNKKEPFEFLGIEIGRNSLRAGINSRSKISRLKSKRSLTENQKNTMRGLKRYIRYISNK